MPTPKTFDPAEPPTSAWGLRPGDQTVMALIAAVCLLLLSYRTYQTLGPAPQQVTLERLERSEIVFRIDINQTDGRPLVLLPGISATLARRLIEFRDAHGPFRTPSDLQQVPGIGAKLTQRITPYLTGWEPAPDLTVAAPGP